MIGGRHARPDRSPSDRLSRRIAGWLVTRRALLDELVNNCCPDNDIDEADG